MDEPVRCGPVPHEQLPDHRRPGRRRVPAHAAAVQPHLIAGSTTDQAGGYSDFSLLLQRGDGQQRIERLQFKAPAGLPGEDLQRPAMPRTAGV